MIAIVEVEYLVDVLVVVDASHLNKWVVHKQVRCPFVVGAIFTNEVRLIYFVVQQFPESASGWREVLGGEPICARLQDAGWDLYGYALGWLPVCGWPVDVTRVHDPDFGVVQVYSIDDPQRLPADELIIQIQLHNDIANSTVHGNCNVSTIERIQSLAILNNINFLT